ncbi:ABC transporter ATP-binding protein [Rathayibacter rathayi]|uniref:ABC transporter ATP-binding protein n=1 Tax=Rathayibacter rathayi TaxID=33887 RepID=A0ABX5A864_RATRA|nr:ABC transporter ATP-binding protein [Rathayibacter rathayi]PPF82881.1 ABC transporter ATP-binding protein [Rathayibacter rathayi]PPG10435.1 ABC transporter ATP-binding protein [Rathayibacter rathayi]PPG46204.1 ABC transporter ATP-binding protein [Rathayibacter rathayi]PPH34850.1 ABC transporter ATP-binding protein [Rathayibacter rathayi]PPH72333.1 ABC transporter ATP-binding protein [Rathayibacter rathayi]
MSTTPSEDDVVLDVRNLSIEYETGAGTVRAVDDVSFTIRRGETFGLAGESGSGKSTIAIAILRLLGANGRVVSGSIHCDGVDVTSLDDEELRRFRWSRVSMVFQSAMNALNPVMTVGDQIVDVLTTHRGDSRRAARERAAELLELVGIDRARIDAFPHQLSGGMRQRAVIAIALALEPPMLIMDEPTTALDVVVQQEIIHEIKELQQRLGFAILFITHDLSLMVEISQRLGVMRHGRLLESGVSREVYANPQSDYTRRLIAAFPPIQRGPVAAIEAAPAPEERQVVLAFSGLTKEFRTGGIFSKKSTVAVDHADLDVHGGEIMALVGESGSGKSTIARMLARLVEPTSGRMVVDGVDVLKKEPRRASRAYRRTVQMVFQDPFGSLNPTKKVRHFLERPLVLHAPELNARERTARAEDLLQSVELDPAFLDRYPHELSGGQRQRVAVARALAADPTVILADEPTSMLDVSVRMGVLQLLRRLRDERGISILYITHDLASARFLADTTSVMLQGVLVEGGSSAEVMDAPSHPYTQLLISAAPDPHRTEAFDRADRAQARAEIASITSRRSAGADRGAVQWLTPTHWVNRDGVEDTDRDSLGGVPDTTADGTTDNAALPRPERTPR